MLRLVELANLTLALTLYITLLTGTCLPLSTYFIKGNKKTNNFD